MKNKNKLLLISLLFIPTVVFASTSVEEEFPLFVAFIMEAFVSIHMTVFVLVPLGHIFGKDKPGELTKKLFFIRAVILIVFDLFITTYIAMIDFFMVFIGAFIIVPISAALNFNKLKNKKVSSFYKIPPKETSAETKPKVSVICKMCDSVLKSEVAVCPNCGADVTKLFEEARHFSPIMQVEAKYLKKDDEILFDYIEDTLKRKDISLRHLVSSKHILLKNILLVVLFLISIIASLVYYFNYDQRISTTLIIISFIIAFFINLNLNIKDHLMKQAQNNPDMDIERLIEDEVNNAKTVRIPTFVKMIVVTFLGVAIPAYMFKTPTLLYTKYEDGYKVFKYTRGLTETITEVKIPSTYKGKKVLVIGEAAFKNTNVTKVTLPEGIISIHTKAFENTKLTEVVLPSTIKEIRAYAFYRVKTLKSINLPEGLEEIRAYAFYDNHKLSNVVLPNSLKYIGASAFEGCASIEEIIIPESITEIYGATFKRCSNLRRIKLHDGIISIHGEAFMYDYLLDDVTLPKFITEIRGSTFEGCSSLTSIEIPNGVTRIGGHAFHGTALSYVFIPENVIEIGSSAFRSCPNLKKVDLPYKAYINERAFKDTRATLNYY